MLLLAGNIPTVAQTVTYPSVSWLEVPVVQLPDGTKYYDLVIHLGADGKYTVLEVYEEPETTQSGATVSDNCTSNMITAQTTFPYHALASDIGI